MTNRSLEFPLDGDNLLAAAIRMGLRHVAAEHQAVHRQPQDGCEGCDGVRAAATLRTTAAEDKARWFPNGPTPVDPEAGL